MELKPNIPLDTRAIAKLIADPEDLFLVWPKARWPFDHDQWRRALAPASGHHPFLIYDKGRLIGHAALRATGIRHVYSISYLFLRPAFRRQGRGQAVMALLESYAQNRLGAHRLSLVVRTYNPRAQACYQKCGFKAESQEGSLIYMVKELMASR